MTASANAGFTCPVCGITSHNPNDLRHGYCGRCHGWTGNIVVTEFGWRVKKSDCGLWFVGVTPMFVNWRVMTSSVDAEWWPVRYWCYAGRGRVSFLRAVLAALAWSGSDDTEPLGWNKNGQTGEWRPPNSGSEHPRE